MKALFVTPNSSGSGEAITALHMGQRLASAGHQVSYLTHPYCRGFLERGAAGEVREISNADSEVQRVWERALSDFRPDLIVFADYPLLYLSRRGKRLLECLEEPALDEIDVKLATLDHLGLAQGPMTIPFGPPHCTLTAHYLPAIPGRIEILSPCPIQSPKGRSGRQRAFRQYGGSLALDDSRRTAVRKRVLKSEDELLIFHSVPTWALKFCDRYGLPNYQYFQQLVESWLGGLGQPATVVSVNGRQLLGPSTEPNLRLLNLNRISPEEYDELLLAADLMLTDNRISSSLGKAVCGGTPCATLRNSKTLTQLFESADAPTLDIVRRMESEKPGAVFPYEVFPIWSAAELEKLCVLRDNPINECIQVLELYGGEATRERIGKLLLDDDLRAEMRGRCRAYAELLGNLPTSDQTALALL